MPYKDFRNNELPQQTNLDAERMRTGVLGKVKNTYLPQLMMAMRSPSRSASSMKWVVRMIVRPSLYLMMMRRRRTRMVRVMKVRMMVWLSLYLINKSQIARREYGSTPAVGSSRTTTLCNNPSQKQRSNNLKTSTYFDPPTKAQAMLSFLCIPPDKF